MIFLTLPTPAFHKATVRLTNSHWSKTLSQLTPQQREAVMYWVGGLAPLATNLFTPTMTQLRFQHSTLPKEEQRKNVIQEIARQTVSAATHILTYFGSSLLLGSHVKNANRNLLMFLAGTAASFVGYAIIRPLISSEIILHWLYSDQASPTRSSKQTPIKSAHKEKSVFRCFGIH